MENYAPNYGHPLFQIYITAVQDGTKVTVQVPPLNFKQEKSLNAGQGVTIDLPTVVEMYRSEKSLNTIRIQASADVSVTSFSYKLYTADTSVIYPISEWGTEYYIFTPPGTPYGSHKEFALTNGKENNKVEISLEGTVHFEGRIYGKGSKMVIDLKPYESVQLQSYDDLSGSKVTSQQPVAVFAGHTCTWRFSKCNHVYEQLLPTGKWGTSFIIAPLTFQTKFDSIYLQASQSTQVTLQHGNSNYKFKLSQGETKEVNHGNTESLFIQSDHGIQVLLLFNGAEHGWFQYYDPFLMTIMPTDHFCSSYLLQGIKGFDNRVLVVAQTSATEMLQYDNVNLPRNVQWKKVAGTDFSWTEMSYPETTGSTFHTLSSSSSSFALYSIGLSQMNGYGSPGHCTKQGKRHYFSLFFIKKIS